MSDKYWLFSLLEETTSTSTTTSSTTTTAAAELTEPLAGRRRRPLFSTEARKPGSLFTRTRAGGGSTDPSSTTERARTRFRFGGGDSTTATSTTTTTTTSTTTGQEQLEDDVTEDQPEIENVIETSAETEKPRESLVERFKGFRRQRPQQQQRPSSTSARLATIQ